MIDFNYTNDIVNNQGIIVTPGKLQSTDIQLALIINDSLPDDTFWAIFPKAHEQLTADEFIILCLAVGYLNPVTYLVSQMTVEQLAYSCGLSDIDELLEHMEECGVLKIISKNLLINHDMIRLSSIPQEPVLPANVTRLPQSKHTVTPRKRCKIIKFPIERVDFNLN